VLTLYQISRGHKLPSAKMARRLDEASNGAVSRHELRPDIFGPLSPTPPVEVSDQPLSGAVRPVRAASPGVPGGAHRPASRNAGACKPIQCRPV